MATHYTGAKSKSVEAVKARGLKNPPGPRGHRLVGSLLEVRRDRLSFAITAAQNYGDIVGFRMGPKRLYLLNHPDYAKHILCDNSHNYTKGLGLAEAKPLFGEGLLTSEGDLWSSQRRLLQIAFQSGQIEAFSHMVVSAASSLVNKWEGYARRGEYFNVADEIVRLTLAVLDSTLLRIDSSSHAVQLGQDVRTFANWAMTRMAAVFKWPLQVPTFRNVKARRALRRIEAIVSQAIDDRRRGHEETEADILALLLSHGGGCNGNLSEKQIRDEVITFLVAGHETTASILTWTLFLLSRHPEVESRLQAELDTVLGNNLPGYAHLSSLVYTRMVVEEVMRLYPPIWLIPRKARLSDEVGGFHIPANSDTLLSVYSIHRHPSFWERPESFEPQRFTPDNNARRVACSYLPFGAGPRTCIGSRFGLMEAILVIALVAQRFCIRLAPEYKAQPDALLTLRPREGPFIKLVGRRQARLARQA